MRISRARGMSASRLGCLAAVLSVLLLSASVEAQIGSDRLIEREQRRIQRQPGNASAYVGLADALIRKMRETADASYLARAEEALRKAIAIAPRHAGAARHLAHVLATRHDFAAAAAEAERAVALDPTDGDAHGVLGDAYLELGDYERAGRAYDTMMRLKADLAAYSRAAALRNLRGDPRGAIRQLERAVRAGRSTAQPRESVAWAEWQLGAEHFAIGELAAAEARYRAALDTYPGYYRALAGLAQVRAAKGRDSEAVRLYEQALAVAPLPEYAAGLGDLHARAGRAADARKQYELVEHIGRLSALDRSVYNRELAYFYADHDVKLDTALDLAQRELAARHDIYAHDLLAWALHKAGRSREALGPMAEALRLGTRDARLFFHAGMIHRATADLTGARDNLSRALATNPHFHVLHAPAAAQALAEVRARLAGAAYQARR